MAANSDLPPTHTIKPIDPPPASDQPTTAMLKGDIDSGRTGDKVRYSIRASRLWVRTMRQLAGHLLSGSLWPSTMRQFSGGSETGA